MQMSAEIVGNVAKGDARRGAPLVEQALADFIDLNLREQYSVSRSTVL
jgi:hypothetical protein